MDFARSVLNPCSIRAFFFGGVVGGEDRGPAVPKAVQGGGRPSGVRLIPVRRAAVGPAGIADYGSSSGYQSRWRARTSFPAGAVHPADRRHMPQGAPQGRPIIRPRWWRGGRGIRHPKSGLHARRTSQSCPYSNGDGWVTPGARPPTPVGGYPRLHCRQLGPKHPGPLVTFALGNL